MTFEERITAGERIISRREALQLGVLVLMAPTAGTLLAACHDGGAQAGGGGTSPTASLDAEARMVTFAGPRGKLTGAYAEATKPTGAVLVIHDSRGLTPHFVALAGRLARAGYTQTGASSGNIATSFRSWCEGTFSPNTNRRFSGRSGSSSSRFSWP